MPVDSLSWPKAPYRGLDFYRESDTLLFRERERDADVCKNLLLGFGVKMLLLQGSSGCGKSSFLRAGLVPALKANLETRTNVSRTPYFLAGTQVVTRCTANPLKEIAQSIVTALGYDTVFTADSASKAKLEGLIDDTQRLKLCSTVSTAVLRPIEELSAILIGALIELARSLPGPLVLVLDQAEEVLTSPDSSKTARPFFDFLETIYLRNIDLRLIISLRTEYYGRFRDELRISDDRLSDRPKSGGVQPYLLHLIKDKESLIRIIEAPTIATESNRGVYNFSYEEGLPAKIADDLLKFFTHSSVTPALQVVCASLYDSLSDRTRTITGDDYKRAGDISGILSNYVDRGIRSLGAKHADIDKPPLQTVGNIGGVLSNYVGRGIANLGAKHADVDKWRATLSTLVSRQGGGTVVSLAMTVEELQRKARENYIKGDIHEALVELSSGSVPLLRGEPPNDPNRFSLKHDVLAVVLGRWDDQHGGAVKAQREAQKRVRLLVPSVLAVFASCVALYQAWVTFDEKERSIDQRLDYVSGNVNDLGRDLQLTLASLDEIQYREYWFGQLTGQTTIIQDQLISQLRDLLRRAPRDSGHYKSVALDAKDDLIAYLSSGSVRVARLEDNSVLAYYSLPTEIAESPDAVVGFMTGIDLVVYANGTVYWWQNGQQRQTDIGRRTNSSYFKSMSAQFIAGELYLFKNEGSTLASVLRVTSATLISDKALDEEAVASNERMPVFSDRIPGVYGLLQLKSKDDNSGTEPQLQLSLHDLNRASYQPTFSIGPAQTLSRNQTLAFAANNDSVLVTDGSINPKFYVLPVPKEGSGGEVKEQLSGGSDIRFLPNTAPQIYPSFAAVRIGQRWRLAWTDYSGLTVVESVGDDRTSNLKFMYGKPLIGLGSDPFALVQFSLDGNYLVSSPNITPSFWAGFFVLTQVWDLGAKRLNWINSSGLSALRQEACRILKQADRPTESDNLLALNTREKPCETTGELEQ